MSSYPYYYPPAGSRAYSSHAYHRQPPQYYSYAYPAPSAAAVTPSYRRPSWFQRLMSVFQPHHPSSASHYDYYKQPRSSHHRYHRRRSYSTGVPGHHHHHRSGHHHRHQRRPSSLPPSYYYPSRVSTGWSGHHPRRSSSKGWLGGGHAYQV